jgi:hypothetical protein
MAPRTALLVCAALCFQACNCGRQTLTKTEASLSLAVDSLEFGKVAEGTSKGLRFRVDNVGRASVTLVVAIEAGSSDDFSLGGVPITIEAGSFVEVPVTFTPHGPGEDQGVVDVSSDKPGETPLTVSLHGGPILPVLGFDPNPLDFHPAASSLVTKTVQLKSTGDAALTITSVTVSLTGNPDFALIPPALPASLLPGESLGVQVEYSQSGRGDVGLLEVQSNDAYAGLRTLQLLPDPLGGADGGSDGGVGDGGCNPDGLFTISGAALAYTCCFNLSVINVSQVQVSSGGTVISALPTQPGTGQPFSAAAATCPSGSFDVSKTLTGGCNETYRIQGSFTGPNTFTGTYSATYTGSDCSCTLLPGGTPCNSQSFPFTATR